MLRLAADDLRGDAARLARAGKARLARGSVRVAGVDRDTGDGAIALIGTAQIGAAHLHRRCAKAVGRKHAGAGTGLIGHDERVIQALGILAKTCMNTRGLKAGRCRNATLDGANLDIELLCIHRPYDSLYQTKNGHRLARHTGSNY